MGTELALLLFVQNTLLGVYLGVVAAATRASRVPTSVRARRTDPR